MILYLDASALVKRYVAEPGSAAVGSLIEEGEAVGTGVISRAEVVAALARAVRTKLLSRQAAASALESFNAEWESLVRVQMTEAVVARAAALAWEHGLRGYDAVHLASAIFWEEMLGEPVTVASFDRQLWKATKASRLLAWPKSLP